MSLISEASKKTGINETVVRKVLSHFLKTIRDDARDPSYVSYQLGSHFTMRATPFYTKKKILSRIKELRKDDLHEDRRAHLKERLKVLWKYRKYLIEYYKRKGMKNKKLYA